MRKVRSSAPYLVDLVPYDPKYLPARVYLNANESPYGLPQTALTTLMDSLSGQMLHRYPDPLAKSLRSDIAAWNRTGEDTVLLGNGGDELLFDIMLAYGGAGRRLLTAPPSFSSYELDAKLTGTDLVEILRVERAVDNELAAVELGVDENALLERVGKGDIDVVMLASPNNPTGDVLSEEFVLALLEASDALVLIDQAYREFADPQYDVRRHLEDHENLAILRTFSKAYALAGIRLGYLLASKTVVNELCKVRQPYSVDAFSALAGKAVLGDLDAFSRQIEESISERRRLALALREMSQVEVFASEANFILIRVAHAHQIWLRLYEDQSILLRDFSAAPFLTDCLRISVGTPEENDEFLAAFGRCLGELL